jgi:hypothetical protein
MARVAIAAEVRAELARQQKTAPDLAALLRVTRQSAYLRLRGKQPFRGEELVMIAEWLGVAVDRFMPLSNASPVETGAA